MTAAVSIEHAWKFYGEFAALKDVSLQVEPGRCLALLGRNGAGKTTLLRALSGLMGLSEGTAMVMGRSPRDPETRRRLSVLGHGVGVYDELTAEENLILFGQLYQVADPRGAAKLWLERTNLAQVADHKVREFSRGMRQRMALARIFLHQPEVLILDEPFTSLDDRSIAMLQGLLEEALSRKATVLLSTHQLREAMELATDVAVMERGQLIYQDQRTQAMLDDPRLIYQLAQAAQETT